VPFSQESSTCPSTETDKFSQYHPMLSKVHFNNSLPPTSSSPLLADSFLLAFRNKILYAFLFTPCVLHAPLTSFFLTCSFYLITLSEEYGCRSQCPRGLRHEKSSLAGTLGSWVRIPIKTWMSVCVHFVFVLFYVYIQALRRADPPSKESYRLCL
jgi:hypothetical protein